MTEHEGRSDTGAAGNDYCSLCGGWHKNTTAACPRTYNPYDASAPPLRDTGAPAGPWLEELREAIRDYGRAVQNDATSYEWGYRTNEAAAAWKEVEAALFRAPRPSNTSSPFQDALRVKLERGESWSQREQGELLGAYESLLDAYHETAALRGAQALPQDDFSLAKIVCMAIHNVQPSPCQRCFDAAPEMIARGVSVARSSLPSGPQENAVPGEPPYSGNTAKRSAARLVHTHTPVDHSAGPLSVEQLAARIEKYILTYPTLGCDEHRRFNCSECLAAYILSGVSPAPPPDMTTDMDEPLDPLEAALDRLLSWDLEDIEDRDAGFSGLTEDVKFARAVVERLRAATSQEEGIPQ